MKSVSESLAGRAAYLTLGPLTRSELAGKKGTGCWDLFLDNPPGDLALHLSGEGKPRGCHLQVFLEEYSDSCRGGLVFHAGDETYWAVERVLAVPWWRVL